MSKNKKEQNLVRHFGVDKTLGSIKMKMPGKTLLAISLLLFCITLDAQFYNGHQMSFGKNRVQYNQFYYQYYRFEQFDTYFTEKGDELALYTAQVAEEEISRVQRAFDYRLEKRMIFLVYNKLTDFRQSNIGLVSGNEENNIGGITRIVNNKVFVYFNGKYPDLDKQIRASVSEVVVNEMMYGNSIKNNITSSTLINLPEWYLKGLYSFISENWSIEIENKVKDGVVSGKYEKFNRLSGDDAVLAGHSFWRYIADEYGFNVIPNIIILTRVNKNANTGFLYVLGKPIKDLAEEWMDYYLKVYSMDGERSLPSDEYLIGKRIWKSKSYDQVKPSPDGKYLAYVTNQLGKKKILLYDNESGKTNKIYREGHKLDQIIDHSFPVLEWHPSGKILTFMVEEEGGLVLYYYTLENKELTTRNFLYYEKVLSYDFSDDGLSIVLSGVRNAKSDIYTFTFTSGTSRQITNDKADDLYPRFIDNSSRIIFSSNRHSDTLSNDNSIAYKRELAYNMYVYDLNSNNDMLSLIGEKDYFNEEQAFELGHNQFVYLSDESGIINRKLALYDSTISHIDTSIHYRYFTKSRPLTNYNRNIQEHFYIAPVNEITENVYSDGKDKIFTGKKLDIPGLEDSPGKTTFRKRLTRQMAERDSIRSIKKKVINLDGFKYDTIILEELEDTILFNNKKVDISNYLFEQEKLMLLNKKYKNDNIQFVYDTSLIEPPKKRIYETSFYANQLVNQVDFSFLNASYQAFTGGAVFYNPGVNLLFKLGALDLFEDYRIVGGIRMAADFDSNEYLLSFENLKKRWDKQAIFHRQAFKNATDSSLIKTHSHEFLYSMKYPFNQVSSVKGTATLRHDRSVFLASNLENLRKDNINKVWTGLKLEYVFDNTRDLGINLYNGTRLKVFGEAYKMVINPFDDLYVIGTDVRHYQKIHRNLIFASRFAASSSQGKAKLIYYLGSVDNWIVFNPNRVFNRDVRYDDTENYAYQTLATNMRGFTQNIRNGNNFALINTELRWPVFSYFANYPISQSFWANFQTVGFFDIGTAWSGITPFAGENAYDWDIQQSGPIRVKIDANRYPIVAGYGFGVRSQLFGYFVRLDWAWGIENAEVQPRQFYFSLSLDF